MEAEEIFTEDDGGWEEIPAESIADLVRRIEAKELRLSFSAMKAFAPPYGSPRQFIYNKLKPREATGAMNFGALLDCILTEPEEEFERRFAVLPADINRRTKIGKLQYEEWLEKNEGKSLVTQREVDLALGLSRRLWMCEESRFVLEMATQTQVMFGGKEQPDFRFFDWLFTGIADFVGDDPVEGLMVADLKVMAQASPRKAKWTIKDLMYVEQLALYRRAIMGAESRAAMYTIGVERSGEVFVCKYGQKDYDLALKKWEMIMSAFDRCVIMGDWERSYGFWAEYESPRTRGIFDFSEI